MSTSGMSPGASPLPPLPDPSSGGGPTPASGPGGGMASIMSGIAPIKAAVDTILAACKQIVQSGTIPGAEQPCGQIVALATSLLPMAVQQAMQPGPQSQAPQGIGPVGGQGQINGL